ATPTTIIGGQTITIANGPTLTLTATDPTAATGTLTFTANPASSSTEAVTGKTYTFVTSVGSTANQVLIGPNANATAQNLRAAIDNVQAQCQNAPSNCFGTSTTANANVTAMVLNNVVTVTAI